ncbi:DUF1205 domain-containing protein [Herbidospora galbida]|uniref:DUF1205 domain-containing protein n=1 Tax=Herbidospora galbida TaxID=2575442 RepID=A0A4U3MH94_9ACTN|nr:nucleotide disphospho-sugar-binding domain-containing protein [Herbidospora galbida]TKK87216.1 DUF1205 domain-containing protein [Herbidospora galbida]
MRVLFTSVALPGHFFPLVPIAWALRAAGHEVLVAVPGQFTATVARAGLPVASCGPEADFVALSGGVGSASEHGRVFGRLAAAGLPGMRELVRDFRPGLVVSERAEFAGPIAAAGHGVPQVEYHWGVAPLIDYRDGAAEVTGPIPEPAERLNPWPPRLRLPYALSHHSLRHVPYNGDAHVPRWALAPAPRPRICVTMGTLLPRLGPSGVRDLVLPLLEGLAGLGAEILVAVDEAVAATWPPLPGAVRAAGRLPLAQVLPGCSLVISHGGQGGLLTALAAGCPQLVLPQFDDQFDNAEAVVRSGAGLSLPPEAFSVAAVVERCRELLGDPAYASAAGRVAAEIRALPSAWETVGLLRKVAG